MHDIDLFVYQFLKPLEVYPSTLYSRTNTYSKILKTTPSYNIPGTRASIRSLNFSTLLQRHFGDEDSLIFSSYSPLKITIVVKCHVPFSNSLLTLIFFSVFPTTSLPLLNSLNCKYCSTSYRRRTTMPGMNNWPCVCRICMQGPSAVCELVMRDTQTSALRECGLNLKQNSKFSDHGQLSKGEVLRQVQVLRKEKRCGSYSLVCRTNWEASNCK